MGKPAFYEDVSSIRKMGATQHLDKGAFAGAILANETQDFSAVQFHGDVFQCMHAGKRFIDLAHLQDGLIEWFRLFGHHNNRLKHQLYQSNCKSSTSAELCDNVPHLS